MKKSFLKLTGLALAAALALGMSGCSSDSDSHKHTFAAEWSSDEATHWHAATCEHTNQKKDQAAHETTAALLKDGTNHWKVCDVCGGNYEVTAHTWNHEAYQYDSESGKEIRTCTECSYVDDQEHQHETTAALSKDGTNHWKVCDVCGGNYEVTAHTEDTGTVTTAPTCVTKGVRTYKCAVCEEVLRTEEIEVIAHTEDTGTVTTAVTLTSDGVRTYRCKSCDSEVRTEVITKPVLYESPVDAETGLAATSSSTYIYFGVFPKTVLPETSDVTVDENVSVTMGANTYYKGSDANWYAKVKEQCYDTGYNYTDGTTVKQSGADSNRYFKVEPVKWKVLTNNYNNTGKALLLAEDILTANVPYYEDYQNNRTIDEKTVYPNNYKHSQIRAYLNGLSYQGQTSEVTTWSGKGFLQTAFTAAAQSKIAETEVDNSKETTGYSEDTYAATYACENTTDKIFLLSESEVINSDYGFAAYDSYGKGNARIRVTTDFAKANYAWQKTTAGYGGYWWLRSPYYARSNTAHYVDYDGYADNDYSVSETRNGVVPALSISF